MASKKPKPSLGTPFPAKIANKLKRQDLFARHEQAKGSARRDARLRRRREEDRNPRLRELRQKRNVPATIDRKRTWDDAGGADEDGLGVSVDVERLKRRKVEEAGPLPQETGGSEGGKSAPLRTDRIEELLSQDPGDAAQDPDGHSDEEEEHSEADGEDDGDIDSMIESSASSEEEDSDYEDEPSPSTTRATSPPQSITSTHVSLVPEALAAKFLSLFPTEPPPPPKVLVTTSQHATLHHEARLLTTLFPNSVYVPRSAHRYAHAYSVREIAAFAARRQYTALVVLIEDQKRPHGLDVVHLPRGPTFHFGISNWIEGRKLPGHGRPTNHHPELICNNFRTPLGLLTAHLFRSLFPARPELRGRQVVTLHNQRDYIFVRRHRYIFREKRETEKVLQGADGKGMRGVEGLRAGLQELGPRFTLKLRRVDRGIQRASGQEWEWKGKTDRVRTKFQL